MEQEFKWRACPEQFEALCAALKLAPNPQATIQMDAIYYDTPDGLLRTHKIGLRLRRENAQSVCCMKLRNTEHNGLHVHAEYECVADTLAQGLHDLPAQGAPADLCAQLMRVPLVPIAHIQFVRQPVLWTQDGFTAELSLDMGTLGSQTNQINFCEIECEYKAGDEAAFQSACETQAARLALTPEPLSKLARALSLSKV